jgi:hypothetical protein
LHRVSARRADAPHLRDWSWDCAMPAPEGSPNLSSRRLQDTGNHAVTDDTLSHTLPKRRTGRPDGDLAGGKLVLRFLAGDDICRSPINRRGGSCESGLLPYGSHLIARDSKITEDRGRFRRHTLTQVDTYGGVARSRTAIQLHQVSAASGLLGDSKTSEVCATSS